MFEGSLSRIKHISSQYFDTNLAAGLERLGWGGYDRKGERFQVKLGKTLVLLNIQQEDVLYVKEKANQNSAYKGVRIFF